jgi:hypothetical protein
VSQTFDSGRKVDRSVFLYDWKIDRLDIAHGTHCQCPGCPQTFKRGTAYIAVDENGKEFEIGSTCVKKYDPRYDHKNHDDETRKKNKKIPLPKVPDFTRGIGSLEAFKKRPNGWLLGPQVRESSDDRVELTPRLMDEAFLRLWVEKLPRLGIHPQHGPHLPTLPMRAILQAYRANRETADLTQIRALRESPLLERHNRLDVLLDCYAKADYVAQFLDPEHTYHRTLHRDEVHMLRRYKAELRDTNELSDKATNHLNGLIARAHERAKPFKTTPPAPVAADMFQNVSAHAHTVQPSVPEAPPQPIFVLTPPTAINAPRKPPRINQPNPNRRKNSLPLKFA